MNIGLHPFRAMSLRDIFTVWRCHTLLMMPFQVGCAKFIKKLVENFDGILYIIILFIILYLFVILLKSIRFLRIKNKQNRIGCCFLHPVRDVSLGRNDMQHGTLHPVRDASLMGCRRDSSFAFSTERCIPNGIQFKTMKPLQVIYFSFLNKIMNR